MRFLMNVERACSHKLKSEIKRLTKKGGEERPARAIYLRLALESRR